MKAALAAIVAVLLLLPSVLAVPTVVNGVAYSGSGITSAPNADVNVEVTCNGNEESDLTDANGAFRVVFEENECANGDSVEACVGENCESKTVLGGVTRFNLLEIKLFDVPEFSTVAASMAVVGAGLGYALLRRR